MGSLPESFTFSLSGLFVKESVQAGMARFGRICKGGYMEKIQPLIRLSGVILLAIAVSVGVLALIFALQHPQVVINLASIGWNGMLKL